MSKFFIVNIIILLLYSCSISTEKTTKCYDHNNPECVFTTCKTNAGCLKDEYCEAESQVCLSNSDFCENIDCGNGYCSVGDSSHAIPDSNEIDSNEIDSNNGRIQDSPVQNQQIQCICDEGYIASGLRCFPEDLCDGIDCGNGYCSVGDSSHAIPDSNKIDSNEIDSNNGRIQDSPVQNQQMQCICDEGYIADGMECKEDLCFGIDCGYGNCIIVGDSSHAIPDPNEIDSNEIDPNDGRIQDSPVQNQQMQCVCDFGYEIDENYDGKCVLVDLCEDVICDESQNCVLGNCIDNSSFCSQDNQCVDSHHCWESSFNDDLVLSNNFSSYEMVTCKQAAHIFVIPKGQKWKIELSDLPNASRVFIYNSHFLTESDFSPLYLSNMSNEGVIDIEFSANQSGEHVLLIERNNVFSTDNYKIKANCIENCDLNSTRYPNVLIHGYAGTDNYFGLADYFWKVKDTLTQKGYLVFTPQTRPIDESEDRAIELSTQIDKILKETGARKLNLIAHSQGGLDSRVLITGLGYYPKVASLTTIGTPHRGIGIPLEGLLSVQDFSPEYARDVFNPSYPDMEDVKYWSYSARTCGALRFSCQNESGGETVNILLSTTHVILRNKYGDNDGVVPTYSMLWGEHLGLLFADHFDEIGQIFDNNDNEDDAFRHLIFYENEMKRLKNKGF